MRNVPNVADFAAAAKTRATARRNVTRRAMAAKLRELALDLERTLPTLGDDKAYMAYRVLAQELAGVEEQATSLAEQHLDLATKRVPSDGT